MPAELLMLLQADGKDAVSAACASSRSAIRSFPAQECQGLLWVWPEAGADAWLEASATPPVTVPELSDPAWAGNEG